MLSADKLVRIGIIGAGFARTTQIPGFQNCPGARIVAIASARREHAEKVARQFGIESATDDWRALVARDDLDLVSVVTPPALHLEMTLAALERRKAVLCEKPMAMNADEARRMTERAREAGVLALIDHELRFLPGRINLRELLHRGDAGRVWHVTQTFRSDSRVGRDRPWDWWSDAGKGGGSLGAIGSHVVDGFRWLLGTEISEVFGSLATRVRERKDEASGQWRAVTTDDETNLFFRFKDSELTEKATGNVSLSMVQAGESEHSIEVFGSQGAFKIEESGQLWRSQIGDGRWEKVETDRGDLAEGIRDSGWARAFTAYSRKIVAAVREGRSTLEGAATFADGYRTQLVLDAARRSHERCCWTEVS